MRSILAADIGGTNSRFALFRAGGGRRLELSETLWLSTTEAGSFRELIDNLRASPFPLKPEDADIVVIAIAGPVERGMRSSPPLISWDVDITNAARDFGFRRCLLINDFIAQAHACLTRPGEEAEPVLSGTAQTDAAVAVIGAGTGLGKAVLVPDGRGGHVANPSEGGHTNFPFVSEREHEFDKFLLKERNEKYITLNTVVSGAGLSYVHRFLTGERLGPSEVAANFKRSPETLEWAARFYGRVCRNFALETVSMGGLYIAGGVAAKSPELVRHAAFEAEFRSSDTLSLLLAKIPVFLIRDENSGLWGAASFASGKLLK